MNDLRINGHYRFVNNSVECEMFPKHSCNFKLIGHLGSVHVLINQREPRKCLLHFEGHGGSVDGVWLAGKAGNLANGILLICIRTLQIRLPLLLISLPCKQQHAELQYIEPERARCMLLQVATEFNQYVRSNGKPSTRFSCLRTCVDLASINCFPVLSSVHRLDYHFCRMGGVDVLTDSGSGEMMAG